LFFGCPGKSDPEPENLSNDLVGSYHAVVPTGSPFQRNPAKYFLQDNSSGKRSSSEACVNYGEVDLAGMFLSDCYVVTTDK